MWMGLFNLHGEGRAVMSIVNVAEIVERQRLGPFLFNLLFWLSLIMFFDGYNTQAISYAVPSIARAWGMERGSFGIVFSIGFAGAFVGSIIAGVIADRIGRKPTIITAAFLFSAFTLCTAATANIVELCFLRFLCGLAIGAMVPPAIALSIEFAPSRYRATFATIITVGYMLGTSAGGIIARLFMPDNEWHVIFLVGGCFSLVIAASLVFTLSESLSFLVVNHRRRDRIERVLRRLDPLMKVGTGDTFTVDERKGAQEAEGWVRIGFLFKGGMKWVTLTLCLSLVVSSWEANSLLNWMPTLAEGKGVAAHDAVLTLTYYILAGTVGSLILMRFIDKWGPIAIVAMPLLACPVIALLGYEGLSPLTCVGLFSLSGLFVQGGHFGLSAMSGMSFPSAYRASGYAVCSSAGRLGGSIGPYFGGMMFLRHMALGWIFAIYALIPLLLAATVFVFTLQYRRMREQQADTDEGGLVPVLEDR
jgi:AAHS family 4-hydroxybenzoate transporter-like MFS transporter